ncbi:MAG TPA: hypothetical protein VIT41_00605 [Microlunatus sp.]
MPAGVGQRLGDDPVRRHLHRRRQGVDLLVLDLGRQTARPGGLRLLLDRGQQPEIVQRRGPEPVRRFWPVVAESWALVVILSMMILGPSAGAVVAPLHLLVGYTVLGVLVATKRSDR